MSLTGTPSGPNRTLVKKDSILRHPQYSGDHDHQHFGPVPVTSSKYSLPNSTFIISIVSEIQAIFPLTDKHEHFQRNQKMVLGIYSGFIFARILWSSPSNVTYLCLVRLKAIFDLAAETKMCNLFQRFQYYLLSGGVRLFVIHISQTGKDCLLTIPWWNFLIFFSFSF